MSPQYFGYSLYIFDKSTPAMASTSKPKGT